MGTKVHPESLLPGHHSMRDLNEDSRNFSWHLYYTDDTKTLRNGPYCNGFRPTTMEEDSSYSGYEKDVMRRTMLEHEAVFKNQVYELHRLHRTQRDMMNELKRKEFDRSQLTYDDARKWRITSLPSGNPMFDDKGSSSKDAVDVLEIRPMKVRRKMIDLRLPADTYIDNEEDRIECNKNSNLNVKFESQGDSLRFSSELRSRNGLADLNESINDRDSNGYAFGYPQRRDLCNKGNNLSINPRNGISLNSINGKEHALAESLHLGAGNDYTKELGSSQPMQFKGFAYSGSSKIENRRERTFIDLDPVESPINSYNASTNKHMFRNLSENNQTMCGFYENHIDFYGLSNGSKIRPKRDVNLNVAALETERNAEFSLNSDPRLDNCGTKKSDATDFSGCTKIFGRSIFYEPRGYKDRSDGGHNINMLDMNAVPCDTSVLVSDQDRLTESRSGKKNSVGIGFQIDLNMSLSEEEGEEEDCSSLPGSRSQANAPLLDLEALALPESDEQQLEKMAAEAIMAISSACPSSDDDSEDILLWFAETIHCKEENLDYFEKMTLELPEVKEDEYMPKPLIPEDMKLEEHLDTNARGNVRRGNARRGRQRRDFQRDILPGLTTLSRHQVTEDVLLFEGFMKAMGIAWNSGLTRRKTGSTRGRRRKLITDNSPLPPLNQNPVYSNSSAIQRPNHVSGAGFEDKSIAGWGKMTRRPRRQRFPAAAAGNGSHAHFA